MLYSGDGCSQPSTAKALHLGIQPTADRKYPEKTASLEDMQIVLCCYFLITEGYHLHNVCTQSRVLSVTWRLCSSSRGYRRTSTGYVQALQHFIPETEAVVGYGIHRESWNPSPTDTGGWRCKSLPLRRLESGRRKVGQMKLSGVLAV